MGSCPWLRPLAHLQQYNPPTVTVSPSPTASPSPSVTPSPGTTLARDTFQRINQQHWGKASDGQTWGGDANNSGVFSIVNNAGQLSNGGNAYNAVPGPVATDSEVIFSIIGTTLAANVWQTGAAEPSGWMVTVADSSLSSGFCGLHIQMQSGVTATITSFQALT